jgi:hypothetical protein
LDLAGMIADVQRLTGVPDVELAPGVRMRINPGYLAELGWGEVERRRVRVAFRCSIVHRCSIKHRVPRCSAWRRRARPRALST